MVKSALRAAALILFCLFLVYAPEILQIVSKPFASNDILLVECGAFGYNMSD